MYNFEHNHYNIELIVYDMKLEAACKKRKGPGWSSRNPLYELEPIIFGILELDSLFEYRADLYNLNMSDNHTF